MKYFIYLVALLITYTAYSQHEHNEEMEEDQREIHEMENHETMEHSSGFIGIPMSMEASGTSWQPEASPMFMSQYRIGSWGLTLHGDAKIRYTHQGGPRGEGRIGAPNWVMISVQNMVATNMKLMIRTMLSLDRFTEGGSGYALLFQTGESWEGKPLIDRQHPHDLVGELAAVLSYRISEDMTTYIYAGYPGEPALGPPAYLHRVSAMALPDAPLGHHWQDATHIVFGVGTLGVSYKKLKLEGSIFTGEEPDDNRLNFDKPTFNSFSARLTFNPSKSISMQVSSGLLKNAEEVGENLVRTTASLIHAVNYSPERYWATAIVWGGNDEEHGDEIQHSLLVETSYFFTGNTIFLRGEFVQKPRKELGFETGRENLENIQALSIGYSRKLLDLAGADLSLGVQGTVNSVSTFLESYYGRDPFSYQIYLGIRPSMMAGGM